MAKRLTPEEKQKRAEEKARKAREREEARAAKRKAKEKEKARKTREKEEKKRQKEIERGSQMKRRPSWLYWLIREQKAKEREHELYQDASRAALALGRAIRRIQKKIKAFIGPILDELAKMKTATARLIWSSEPWTPQDRTRYNWGKKKELEELLEEFPDGIAEQDPEQAAKDARRKTKARQIDRAKAINKVLDKVLDELAEDEQNAVRSSLEISAEKVAKEIQKELDSRRQAIDADKENETRIADAKDLTSKGNPRRTAPEKSIPKSMPQLGNYGESVIFGAPSPDQIKAVVNAQYEGADFSERIWKERDKLAQELKSMMQAAIINGENSAEVARKLAQKMGVTYSHAERLVRTEMNRILNDVSFNEMKAAGAESYMWVAIEDGRTCGRCKKKNRKIFKVSDKKIGLNAPPLHPYCRCTIVARFAWEDEDAGSAKETLSEIEKELKQLQKELEEEAKAPKPQKKEPGYFEQEPDSKITEEARQWMLETGLLYVADDGKTKAKKALTKANIEAAAQAQDDAMKRDEQRMKTAIGIQKRAIAQGKPIKEETQKKKEQTNRTEEEKELIRELVESGKKVSPENVVAIIRKEGSGIVWLETGDQKSGLEHIIKRHAKDFEARGIKKEDIPKFIKKALKHGERIETKESKGGEEVILKLEGKQYKIVIASNGFIVTAYPVKEK